MKSDFKECDHFSKKFKIELTSPMFPPREGAELTQETGCFSNLADAADDARQRPLMTLSGHLAFIAFFTAPDGPWSGYLCNIVS